MLLESRLNDKATVIFDCESVGGLDKGAVSVTAHPDKIVPYALEVIRAVAGELGKAMDVPAERKPRAMTIEFAVRVDSNAVVQIARGVEQGQFKVTLQFV
ncbi:MAG: CU044_2847 family protein [Myxococcota bacterium]